MTLKVLDLPLEYYAIVRSEYRDEKRGWNIYDARSNIVAWCDENEIPEADVKAVVAAANAFPALLALARRGLAADALAASPEVDAREKYRAALALACFDGFISRPEVLAALSKYDAEMAPFHTGITSANGNGEGGGKA